MGNEYVEGYAEGFRIGWNKCEEEIMIVLGLLEENKQDYDYVKSTLEKHHGVYIDRGLWEHSRKLTLLALRIRIREMKSLDKDEKKKRGKTKRYSVNYDKIREEGK